MAESDRYEVLGKIGQGSFGVISKVRRKSDGLILCRKEISYFKMSAKEKEQLQAELSILKELRHPHIVQYYEREHLKLTQDLHMYMEYCGNGDLGQVIKDYKKRGEQAPEAFVWSIFAQIATALYRCHNGVDAPEVGDNWFGLAKKRALPVKGQKYVIIHRDLKPENIFLDSSNNVKLGDFGLSKIIKSHDFASTYVGTPYYMSPELAGNERYTSASDIWSLGCIIYELCTQEVPFNARSHIELFQKIRLGKFRAIPPVYSQELQKVIASCLQTNPNSRPTAAQLLDLPIVCVVRKQQEAVLLHKELQSKSEGLEAKAKSLHDQVDAKLRREWEVKARLEIDKQVAVAKADLIAQFDAAVAAKAEALFQARMKEIESRSSSGRSSLSGQTAVDPPQADITPRTKDQASNRSYLMSGDLGVNLTQLSLASDSPLNAATAQGARRSRPTRAPLARAHTVAVNASAPSFEMQDCFSPMDVHMASPAPAPIDNLNLSPRRNAETTGLSNRDMAGNIFAAANAKSSTLDRSKRWIATSINDVDSDSDTIPDSVSDDELSDSGSPQDHTMNSPSRTAPKRTAHGMTKTGSTAQLLTKRPARPSLARERTAPANLKRFTSAPTLFPTGQNPPASTAELTGNFTTTAAAGTTRTTRSRPTSTVPPSITSPTRKPTVVESPSRPRSKIPDAAVTTTSSSPRKAVNASAGFRSKKATTATAAPSINTDDSSRTQPQTQTQTQLRAATTTLPATGVHGRTLVELAQARAGGVDRSTATAIVGGGAGGIPAGENRYTSPMKGCLDGVGVPLWDPERDEMPSPFLARGRIVRGVR